MPRALSYSHVVMPSPENRESVLAHLRQRRDHLAAEGCRHWLFRSANEETVLEFTEAPDEATLAAGHQRAGMSGRPIYTELELP